VGLAAGTSVSQYGQIVQARSKGFEQLVQQRRAFIVYHELLEAGVPGLHFYTFNRARGPIEILGALRGQQLLAS